MASRSIARCFAASRRAYGAAKACATTGAAPDRSRAIGGPRGRRARHRCVGRDHRDGAPAGLAAFSCLIHCARAKLGRAVAEPPRAHAQRTSLTVVHAGKGEVGREELYGKSVALVERCFPKTRCVPPRPPQVSRITPLRQRLPYPRWPGAAVSAGHSRGRRAMLEPAREKETPE